MAGRRKSGPAATVREVAANTYRIQQQFSIAVAAGRIVGAADFKANCLALMDEVQQTGRAMVITKHNKPVAKLVPVLDVAPAPFVGRGTGMFAVAGDILSPVAPDWSVGDDI